MRAWYWMEAHMNIQRYKWPVIVAASLHGALLLYTPDHPSICLVPEAMADPGPKPPAIEVDMRVPADLPEGGEASGTVSPLPPVQPEIALLANPQDFTIPAIERATPDRAITDLKTLPSGPIGPREGTGPIGTPRMVGIGDLDRVPRAMGQSAPEYPYSMRQAGITGSVTVEFVVGTDGTVLNAEAVRWTHREFVDPAVRAVLRWKFEPGTISGRKVRFRMAVPIEFNAT
jgi:protein TonB